MRHFTNTLPNEACFHTFVTDEYSYGVQDAFSTELISERSVAKSLASALDIGYTDLVDYIGYPEQTRLTAGECRVIDELVSLHKTVQVVRSGVRVYREHFERCFIYTNLNTGKSVSWYINLQW